MNRQGVGFQILGSIVGVLCGGVVIGFSESIGHMLFPTTTIEDISQFANVMSAMPFPAKLWVVISWGLGIFVGGLVALFIARGTRWPAIVVAGFLFAGATWTMFQFPHPPWMVVGSVLVTVLGAYGALKVLGAK